MKLNSNEWFVIQNALIVAAEKYDDDAKVMVGTGNEFARLEETFKKQAEDCRKLADRISESEDF